MQGRMKAIVKTKPGPGAELQMVDIPSIGDTDVLVRVQAAALCGTDRAIYQWNAWAQSRIRPPLILGHEMAGTIVEVGRAVTSLKPGDLVSGETHIVCGHCVQCLHNQYHICGNLRILGVDTQGVFSEYVAIPAYNAWKTWRRFASSSSNTAIISIAAMCMPTRSYSPAKAR